MQEGADSQGTGKGTDKFPVTDRPPPPAPPVLISHGWVAEQPHTITPLELWPKRISRRLKPRGMPEGVGAMGAERAPGGQKWRSLEPIGNVGTGGLPGLTRK